MSHGNAPIYGTLNGKTPPHALLQALMRRGHSFSGREANCCFLNLGTGEFANVSAISGFDFPEDGRALGVVDWDQDGDLDVWVKNRNGPQLRFLRNDIARKNDHIAFRLTGTKSNRDAIGARLELELGPPHEVPLVRAIRAGEGFLSQSSKEVLYGLGTNASIKRLTVHWPSGSVERFNALAVNQRYRIVEGSGRASPVEMRRQTTKLSPAVMSSVPVTDGKLVLLSSPLPLPALTFQAFDGRIVDLAQPREKPTLVCLWATWCRPCLKELVTLREAEDELRGAGIDVLALAVDPLEPLSSSASPQQTLQRLDFPFAGGLLTPKLADELQLMCEWLFFRTEPLAVPCCFLVDKHGIQAVFRGPVSPDELVHTQEQTTHPASERSVAALPFAGRQFAPERPHRILWIAAKLREVTDAADIIEYIDNHQSLIGDDPDLGDARLQLGMRQLEGRRLPSALRQFQLATQLLPDRAEAHFALGMALEEMRRRDEAWRAFEKAASLNARQTARLHDDWAQRLQAEGRIAAARRHLRTAFELQERPR